MLHTQEKTILYRRYVTLHGIGISAAFSIAAAWIILSATRHSNAETKCLQDFFSSTDSASSSTEGTTLCNIFPWVDIGIMGGLWVLLGILTVSHLSAFYPFLIAPQLYLFIVLSSYGAAQRRDHDQYNHVYDPSQPLTTEHIPLDNQAHADPWDSRPSIDHNQFGGGYKHVRNNSSVSASDIMNDPYQKPKDGLSNSDYDYSYAYPTHHTVTRL